MCKWLGKKGFSCVTEICIALYITRTLDSNYHVEIFREHYSSNFFYYNVAYHVLSYSIYQYLYYFPKEVGLRAGHWPPLFILTCKLYIMYILNLISWKASLDAHKIYMIYVVFIWIRDSEILYLKFDYSCGNLMTFLNCMSSYLKKSIFTKKFT